MDTTIMQTSYIYILTNEHHNVLYVGVTSDLKQRITQHKNRAFKGFTFKYNVHKLVYYETFADILEAIARENQIKGGSRQKKIDLINAMNPGWEDLFYGI
jgi:putative endonuclease